MQPSEPIVTDILTPLLTPEIGQSTRQGSLFSLSFALDHFSAKIYMQATANVIYTHELPKTQKLLDLFLPGIYQHRCFNNKKLPFSKEVLSTELGHLFEHILLEYLTLLDMALGVSNIIFKGETYWDWDRDGEGTFQIYIYSDHNFTTIFTEALEKSINLLEVIIAGEVLTQSSESSLKLPHTEPQLFARSHP